MNSKKLSQNKSFHDKSLENKDWFYYQVIPSVKAPLFKSFVYKSHLILKAGQRVKVPFGSRQTIGFILKKTEKPSELDIPLMKIKSILLVDENQPPLSPEKLDWFQWMSAYYHYPLGSILNLSFLSPSFKKPKQTKKISNLKEIKTHKLVIPTGSIIPAKAGIQKNSKQSQICQFAKPKKLKSHSLRKVKARKFKPCQSKAYKSK